ncbi:hypothetical protein BH23VER1_BH23VER1_15820 [soil metagenome]
MALPVGGGSPLTFANMKIVRLASFVIAALIIGCNDTDPAAEISQSSEEQRIVQAVAEVLGSPHFSWDGPKSISEIEAIENNLLTRVDKNSEEWIVFRSNYTDEDEIFFVQTSEETWNMMTGRAGFALIRGTKGIAFYSTMMN